MIIAVRYSMLVVVVVVVVVVVGVVVVVVAVTDFVVQKTFSGSCIANTTDELGPYMAASAFVVASASLMVCTSMNM